MLVASYNLHVRTNAGQHLQQAQTLRRHFTSIVFEIVNPEDRLRDIKKITDKYFMNEKSFEDFLNKK